MRGLHRQRASRSWQVNITALLTLAMVGFTACGSTTGTTAGTSPSASTISPTATASVSQTPKPTPASWRRIPVAPIHGYYYTPAAAVWDGKEVLVVATKGGATGDCKEYVVAYDPTLDSWRAMARVPAPEGCFEGSDKPVWTGHELLLWGISNAAYNPATDTWRHLPEPPAGAGGPSVVVWTGTQMIGWGGGCCDQELADGAAYTLATNSWKLLPPSPLAGRHATGVWTGTELIIAGGSGYAGPSWRSFTHFADAAAYNPTTRKWRELSPMPVARGRDYAAVWDGTEMLVGGGTDRPSASADPLARGVAYNPAANTWRWLAPIEFPRTGFVCAWTGHQLVVWGGTAVGGTIPPHGETYDPVTNIWSALPRAPLSARIDAVAVWTGHELIIWGGVDARAGVDARIHDTLSDGAALTPASG
jgi:hypothetical protein